MYFLTRITKIVVRLKLDRFSIGLKLMDMQDDSIPLLLTAFKKTTLFNSFNKMFTVALFTA